jgi:hypothetical protein
MRQPGLSGAQRIGQRVQHRGGTAELPARLPGDRAQMGRAGPCADVDHLSGKQVHRKCPPAASVCAGGDPGGPAILGLWLFAGARRHLGRVSGRRGQPPSSARRHRRCHRFHGLVHDPDPRPAGDPADRHPQPVSGLSRRPVGLSARLLQLESVARPDRRANSKPGRRSIRRNWPAAGGPEPRLRAGPARTRRAVSQNPGLAVSCRNPARRPEC